MLESPLAWYNGLNTQQKASQTATTGKARTCKLSCFGGNKHSLILDGTDLLVSELSRYGHRRRASHPARSCASTCRFPIRRCNNSEQAVGATDTRLVHVSSAHGWLVVYSLRTSRPDLHRSILVCSCQFGAQPEPGLCVNRGYDLRGMDHLTYPECGGSPDWIKGATC